jgi:polyphosphate kinase 2 (PPK2 family)
MLYEDGILLIKFWFSISKEEQLQRFAVRNSNPLKQWKLSPIDGDRLKSWQKASDAVRSQKREAPERNRC